MSETREEKQAKAEKAKDALKITNQFRSKGGMAYDLKCEGIRLTLLISQKTTPDDPAEWRVEARSGRTAEDAAVVTEWGTTPIDAMRAVASAWELAPQTQELRVFDWEAVVKVLQSVRAL